MNKTTTDEVLGVLIKVNLEKKLFDEMNFFMRATPGASYSDIINDAVFHYLDGLEEDNREDHRENGQFTCPECKDHNLVWAQIEEMSYQDAIVENGKLEYGDPEHRQVGPQNIGWHECGDCGYKIRNKHGHRIVEPKDVIEWLKNPVVEEDRF
jgi:DNA-directed RNA polymerase subunit M/transcription elongation factor TFIIS